MGRKQANKIIPLQKCDDFQIREESTQMAEQSTDTKAET